MDKSPRKKLIDINSIFSSIVFLFRFNGIGAEIGVDDQMPILNYAIIKAQPSRMFSNAKFMELYIGDKNSKGEGNQLVQFKGICDLIPNFQHTQLYGVTLKEFNKKCNDAIKENKD